jgi:hypothetical protein
MQSGMSGQKPIRFGPMDRVLLPSSLYTQRAALRLHVRTPLRNDDAENPNCKPLNRSPAVYKYLPGGLFSELILHHSPRVD